MNGPAPVRSYLAKHFVRPTDQADLEAMRARAWLEQGVIALSISEIGDDWLKARLVAEATRRWGRRAKK